MKRFILLIATALLPLAGLAQSKPFFSDETGSFTLVMDMMGTEIVSKSYFIDYGNLQRSEVEVMGQTIVSRIENLEVGVEIDPSLFELPKK